MPKGRKEPMSERWYALRVKPNAEKAIAGALRVAGVEEFLPLVRSRRRWSDRWKEVEAPLFPGYLFCRVSLNIPYRIVKTPGVIGFVGAGGEPEPIPHAEIEAVHRLLDSERRLRPLAVLHVGQRVRVQSGPLAGLDGVVVKFKNESHLVVNLHLLQRAVAVTLDGDAVSAYA